MKYSLHTKRGSSLIETLIYVSILVVIITVLIASLVVLARSYRQVSVSQTLESSALLALDRITSTLRSGESIDLINTTLNSSAGVLTINARSTSSAPYVARFFVSNGVVYMSINGVTEGQLTSSSTQVISLMFRHIDTPVSDAIRTEITIEADVNGETKTENFYTTTILKNSY